MRSLIPSLYGAGIEANAELDRFIYLAVPFVCGASQRSGRISTGERRSREPLHLESLPKLKAAMLPYVGYEQLDA